MSWLFWIFVCIIAWAQVKPSYCFYIRNDLTAQGFLHHHGRTLNIPPQLEMNLERKDDCFSPAWPVRRRDFLGSLFLFGAMQIPRVAHAVDQKNSAAPVKDSKKLFVLQYDFVEDMEVRRQSVRAEHLEILNKADDCLLGGALVNPLNQGMLVFASKEGAIAFAEADPYVTTGLVTNWIVREWMVVEGTKKIFM
mmetsp:Transcript_15985/g.21131  ORF Transcript_15985/g.21131 Transcript_15985/m.21131 type:complete len:194 (+) Transcript_15985:20-601(+)